MDSTLQSLHKRLEETQRARVLEAMKADFKEFKAEVRYSLQNQQNQLQSQINSLTPQVQSLQHMLVKVINHMTQGSLFIEESY